MTDSAVGFIQAMLEDPDDRTTRAIFADWLEDRGDPRTELFRLCLRLGDGVPEVDDREPLWVALHTCLRAFADTLPQRLRRLGRLRLQRGLFRLHTTPRRLVGFSADALGKMLPDAGVEVVRFDPDPAGVVALLARRKLAHVAGLDLSGHAFTPEQWQQLQPDWLTGLVRLDLTGTGLRDADLALLVRRRVLSRVAWLDLRNNRLHGDDVLALLDPDVMPRLRYLGLHGNPLRADVGQAWYRWRRTADARTTWNGLPSRRLSPDGTELRLIPPGTYRRGVGNDRFPAQARPPHRVRLTRPFYVAVFPATQAQVAAVLGMARSHFRLGDPLDPSGESASLPVEEAGRDTARDFCARANEHPDAVADGVVYRLPTEAEWEYACRAHEPSDWAYAGSRTFKGADPFNHDGPGGLRRTCPVGSYTPNAWGLYDLHGNVWDWVSDFYSQTYFADAPEDDPPGPAIGTHGLLRGGSWFNKPPICRITYRCQTTLPHGSFCIGFRIAAGLVATASNS